MIPLLGRISNKLESCFLMCVCVCVCTCAKALWIVPPVSFLLGTLYSLHLGRRRLLLAFSPLFLFLSGPTARTWGICSPERGAPAGLLLFNVCTQLSDRKGNLVVKVKQSKICQMHASSCDGRVSITVPGLRLL